MPKLRQVGKAKLPLKQPSGLAYDPVRAQLWSVGDEGPQVLAIDPADGEIVGAVELSGGIRDCEGIAVAPDGDGLWVVAERTRQVARFDMRGRLIDAVTIPITGDENHGLEGITVDPATGRVFVVHEKRPRVLVELDVDLRIVSVHESRALDDLSGVCAHDGALWLVSDESRKLVRCRVDARGVHEEKSYEIGRDHAEGVAFVGNRAYLVFDDDGKNLRWYEL